MRWGSPLPIPNREVKSTSADGTAFLWESRSLPSSNPLIYFKGFFYIFILYGKFRFYFKGYNESIFGKSCRCKKIISNMITHNLINHENEIQNDHIAFRTLGYKNLGIKSLEKFFFISVIQKDFFDFEIKS